MFRQIILSPDMDCVKAGTQPGCDIRLRKEGMLQNVELILENRRGSWQLSCGKGLYLDAGDVRKLESVKLRDSVSLALFHRETEIKLLDIGFDICFDETAGFERCIRLHNAQVISIGAFENCQICLTGSQARGTGVVLTRRKDAFAPGIFGERSGLYHNTRPLEEGRVIRNGDFFFIADYSFYLDDDCIWASSRQDMLIRGLDWNDLPDQNTYPLFNRKTRIKAVFDEEDIHIQDPGALPVKKEENILFRILPSLGMLSAALIMALRGSNTMLVFSGISAGIAVFTAAAGIFREKKRYLAELEKRRSSYETYISEKRREIIKCRQKEKDIAGYLYRPADWLLSQLERFDPELFDRSASDEDFMCVRLGRGTVPARKKICIRDRTRLEPEDELAQIPEKTAEEFRYIPDSAVICDMKKDAGLGIAGCEEERFFLMKQLIIDITARHYQEDVRLIIASEPANAHKIAVFRMLPHVFLEGTDLRGIITDEDSRDHVFEYLYGELSARAQSGRREPFIVMIFYDDCGFRQHPLSSFLAGAFSLGIAFVFMKEQAGQIIKGCDRIIEICEPGKAVMICSDNMNDRVSFSYERISDKAVKEAVRVMAPVYTEQVALGNRLASEVSLFDLLGAVSVEDIDLKRRWEDSDIINSMKVPLGMSRSGIFFLDIHESAMGPHGLIAGTTGSGKSELLLTYVLSAAASFCPMDVCFLIIDFKGGQMAAQLRQLPHIAGVITNIDGRQAGRSLKAIRAELVKRQQLFDEAGVSHIDKYINKCKESGQAARLGHLVIIADEFAELKAQYPEFMRELISAARIGRSLGVHLILATQKPSGQVDDQIWSNSRFRICLKVQNSGDSNEVLRSALASQIKEPGRAYVQVGNNEIFELVQSAYSSGPADEETGCSRDFEIRRLSSSGKRTVIYRSQTKRQKDEMSGPELSQAQALTEHIRNFCIRESIPSPEEIIKPALSQLIDFPEGKASPGPGSGIRAAIGIYDDPDTRFQGEYSIDLSGTNLIVTGSAGSGKTNILRNIIRSISENYSPEEVNIYIIDCASMSLREFEGLNHVGGVVCAGDEEKTRQLFRFLNEQIKLRKNAGYAKGRKEIAPCILLIIDNLTVLKETCPQDEEELMNLCREGISAGISVAAASPRISGIGYRYLSDFAGRIALYCNDAGEYTYLFGRCGPGPEEIPGRCLIEINRKIFECQAYRAFDETADTDGAFAVEDFIKRINSENPAKAVQIPAVPGILTHSEAERRFCADACGRFEIVAGLDYEYVEPLVLDMSETGVLSLSGRKGAGRHNWIRHVIESLHHKGKDNIHVYAADGIKRRLSWLRDHEAVKEYTVLADRGASCVLKIREILKTRYEAISEGSQDILNTAPLIMLILDSSDAVEAICEDSMALNAYREITGKYREMNVCVIIMCVENTGISYNAPEILKNVRDEKHCLYFDDIRNLKIFDLPGAYVRNACSRISAGDAYYIRNSSLRRLKTPLYQ